MVRVDPRQDSNPKQRIPSIFWADGTVEAMSGTASAELAPGDAGVIETPGGGGYGAP